jgi:hypothetical protein
VWKIDPKDKCIHKYKHDHVYIYYIESMFVIVRLFEGIRGRERRKRIIEGE